jgi:hypothetical protein
MKLHKSIFIPEYDEGDEGGELIQLITTDDGSDFKDENVPNELPILPLRNTVLFPGVVIPITVGRKKSIKLVKSVYNGNRILGVTAQIDKNAENPGSEDVYHVGTIAKIIKLLVLPEGIDGSAADVVLAVRELTGGRGADFVLVTVGSVVAMKQSYAMLAPGGASVLVGMASADARSTFNPLALSDDSRRILGSKMGHCDIRTEIPRLIGLYREGKLKLDELITARFGFDEINTAMDNVRAGVGLRNVVIFGEQA